MIKGEVTMAVQRFSGFSMLRQGLPLSDQGRGQLVLPKTSERNRWHAEVYDFCMEVSDSSSLPCWKDTTATIKPCRKLARLFGRPWDCLAEVITQKGWLKAINRPFRTKVSWPHAHSLDPRCWLASMRQAQMPQFQEIISSVRLV